MRRTDARRGAAWSVRLLVVASAVVALAASAPESVSAQQAPSQSAEQPIVGDVPPPGEVALMSVGTTQTTPTDLVSNLDALGCTAESVFITTGGEWRIYNPEAPEFANAAFPAILTPGQAFAVRCGENSPGTSGSEGGNVTTPTSSTPDVSLLPPRPASTVTDIEYGVEHVIFGRRQLDLLTTGAWSPYVHEDRDAFMLMSGNNVGNVDCELLNAQAAEVRATYATSPIYAAMSGIANIRVAVTCLDTHLFSGIVMVYEPDQANAPEFSWDPQVTEQTIAELASLASAHGLESWTKISGRSTAGRDKFGEWNYADFGSHLTGQIIQSQGSCRDLDEDGDYVNGPREFQEAVDSVLDMYDEAGEDSRLFIRVTASSVESNRNGVSPQAALQCAQAAWNLPGVERVTLRTGVDDPSLEAGGVFLAMRESLLP